jgi:hypothetical protein
MGGVVKGQNYYGLAPQIAVNGSDDIGKCRLLTTSTVE